MFELTNEQRRCFAMTPMLDSYKKSLSRLCVALNMSRKHMSIFFRKDDVRIDNNNTDQCYYRSGYNPVKLDGLSDFSKWVEDWCRCTGEKELRDVDEFSKRKRIRQKFAVIDYLLFIIKEIL